MTACLLRQRQAKSLTKSLTDIPGVGPKNAQLLVAAGYTDVEGIQNFYVSQCQRDAELLQKHLQVGKTGSTCLFLHQGGTIEIHLC